MKLNLYQIRFRSNLDVLMTKNIVAERLELAIRIFRADGGTEVIVSVETIAYDLVFP